MAESRHANFIKSALVMGIELWLGWSKADTVRPSTCSGQPKSHGDKATGLWAMTFSFAITIPANVGAELRDPTQPLLQSTEPSIVAPSDTPLSLTAIMMRDDTHYAIINGKMVKVGDRLDDDSQVVGIRPGCAVIRKTGKNQTLFLVPSVKTR